MFAAHKKARFRKECLKELDIFLKGRQRIVLPIAVRPEVSILIVLFNAAELSFRLFRSLAGAMDVPAEVIVIDNASSDHTQELCARIDGIRLVRNTENLHFLRAANQAAALARGATLAFLNSDIELDKDALRHGRDRLAGTPDAGAVGGKIVLPSGKLQEAGSIVWRDGACLGIGRGRDPAAPEFQFCREVDYCSGAFLMVRKDVFRDLGSFDAAFAPAYYEESDLCMRMRIAGYRTIYDPKIMLEHFEFGSSGHQTATALQKRNRDIFTSRHAEILQREHLPSSAGELLARMRGARRRVLVVDDRMPYDSLGMGYPRANRMVRTLHEAGWFITFYPVSHRDVIWDDAYALWPDDIEILSERGGPGLARTLRERAGYYDVALVSRAHNMRKFMAACALVPEFLQHTRLVYDAEAITASREALRRRIEGKPDDGALKSDISREMALANQAAALIAVSDADATQFREGTRKPVFTVGHALTVRETVNPFDARSGILFVGALTEDGLPNVDSIVWFVREVMPRLDLLLGDKYIFTVIGAADSPAAKALAGPRVHLLGRREEIAPFYDAARIFVAPTRFAAGIPMKVHHAAAHGLPAVVTPLLAGQLGWTQEVEVLTAEQPQDFASACHRLYTDATLWQVLRAQALRRVAADCNPKVFEAQLVEALEVGFAAPPAPLTRRVTAFRRFIAQAARS